MMGADTIAGTAHVVRTGRGFPILRLSPSPSFTASGLSIVTSVLSSTRPTPPYPRPATCSPRIGPGSVTAFGRLSSFPLLPLTGPPLLLLPRWRSWSVWIGAVGFADELRLDGVLGRLIMPLSARDAMLGRDIRTEISGSGVRYGGMRGTRRDAQPMGAKRCLGTTPVGSYRWPPPTATGPHRFPVSDRGRRLRPGMRSLSCLCRCLFAQTKVQVLGRLCGGWFPL
jgi:hypothetical protein